MKALKACDEGEKCLLFCARYWEGETARTEWQDRLSPVIWLLHLPSTFFRMGLEVCAASCRARCRWRRRSRKCFECLASTGVYAPFLAKNPKRGRQKSASEI